MKQPFKKLRTRQRGFTLIEILIVIAIVSALLAGLGVTLANFLTMAREGQTTATLRKIDGLITERQQAVTRFFDSRDFRRHVSVQHERLKKGNPTQGVAQLLGLAPDFVEVITKKRLLQLSLPQRFAEMIDERQPATPGNPKGLGADGIPDAIQFDEVYKSLITWNSPTPAIPASATPANHTPQTESAELLYFALTRMEQFGAPATGTDDFQLTEIADTDNDGLPEFVDGWGNPLRFYRWPTRLVKPFGLLGIDQAYGNAGDDDDGNGTADMKIVDYDEIGFPGTDDTYIHPAMRVFAALYVSGLPRQPILTGLPPRPVAGDFDQLNEDGDDPFGILLDETKRLSRTGIDVFSHVNESTYMTFDTYHKPLVVSAGPDGVLGLMEPYETEDTYSDPSNGIYPYNGWLDDPSEDTNGNGYLDIGWLAQPINEDFNLDGIQQPGEPDLNGNGAFDAFLSPVSALDDLTNRNRRAGG